MLILSGLESPVNNLVEADSGLTYSSNMAKVPPSSRSAMTKESIKSSLTSGGPSSASRQTMRPAPDTRFPSTSRVVKSRAGQVRRDCICLLTREGSSSI
jgi:hypothetical protein